MSRPKGRHKTGGRQAGTPNKITGSLKGFITDLLNDNREQIKEDLKAMRPKERIAAYLNMMQYVLPKQQAVSADVSPDLLSRELVIRHVGSDGEEIFPSSEDQVDIERADFKNN
jgi:hypothetical protein